MIGRGRSAQTHALGRSRLLPSPRRVQWRPMPKTRTGLLRGSIWVTCRNRNSTLNPRSALFFEALNTRRSTKYFSFERRVKDIRGPNVSTEKAGRHLADIGRSAYATLSKAKPISIEVRFSCEI